MVFHYVLFPLSFYLYILVSISICIYLSLGMIVCKLFILLYISAWEIFWLLCRWVGYASLSLHTHIMHIMSGALYPGLCNLELEGIV